MVRGRGHGRDIMVTIVVHGEGTREEWRNRNVSVNILRRQVERFIFEIVIFGFKLVARSRRHLS